MAERIPAAADDGDDAAVLARLRWLSLSPAVCRGWPAGAWVRFQGGYAEVVDGPGSAGEKIEALERFVVGEFGASSTAVADAIEGERRVVARYGPPTPVRPLRAIAPPAERPPAA